ncbi:MAG: B12-binding domain-containing radical SAM protein [Spirochaetota bacterium]
MPGRDLAALRVVLVASGAGARGQTNQLGIACVAAAIDAAAREGRFAKPVEVLCFDATGEMATTSIIDRLAKAAPAFVGLSVYIWNRNFMTSLAKELRLRIPAARLFAGGPEATADPFGLISESGLDFVVVGEGEEICVDALALLAKASAAEEGVPGGPRAGAGLAALAGLPGIAAPEGEFGGAAAFRPAGAASVTGLASPWLAPSGTAPSKTASSRPTTQAQASSGPDPRAESPLAAPGPGAYEEVSWELSRGCPFHCTYCYEGRGIGGVRAFPLERLREELRFFVNSGVRRIFVLDPTFDWNRRRALELLGLFSELGKGISFRVEARAELLDRALAKAFAAIDVSIQIGLQSAQREVLERVGRPGFDPDAFAGKLALLDAEGVTWGLDLMYGLPGDKLPGFRKSLDYALGLQPNHLDIFPLAVLPGTELANNCEEFGMRVQEGAPHLLVASAGFPESDMAKAAELAAACDLFYTRGRAVSWFLRVLAPLRARPSAFLGRFAEWSQGRKGANLDPEALQLAFVEAEYMGRGKASLMPLVRDIIRFEGAWGRAIAEGQSTDLELSHDAGMLLDPPCPDLAGLARLAARRHSRVRVAPGKGGPRITQVK